MGHIQDRWYRPAVEPITGKPKLDAKGNAVREKTALYGKGNRYKVRYLDPDGIEKSESFPDRQLAAARAFLHKVENDKLHGTYLDPNAGLMTFTAHSTSWLRGQSADAATQQTLRSRLNSQLVPFFGKRQLVSITPAVVRDWLGSINDRGLDTGYQALLFDTLTSVMSAAVEDKKIRSNPCHARSVKKPRRVNRRIIPWTESRLSAVHSGMERQARIAAPLGAGLGLRQGEILAFAPDDLDREAMVAHVVRQIRVVGRALVFAPPKGGKTRDVPLPHGVLDEVDEHTERYGTCRVTLPWLVPDGKPETVDLLIVREDGRPWYGDLFNKVVWRGAFRDAGIGYRARVDGMHALRHFYASTLLAQGVSIKELAEYMGHADAKITLDTYTHLMPSSHQRARAAVDTVFQPRRLALGKTA